MRVVHGRAVGALAVVLVLPGSLWAQGRGEDYARVESLNSRVNGKVYGAAEAPSWIGGSNRFWYRRSVKGGNEYIIVDAATAQKRPAFDHARLATSLLAASGTAVTALGLQLNNLEFSDNDQTLQFAMSGSRFRCTLTAYECTRTGAAPEGGRGQGAGGQANRPPCSPASMSVTTPTLGGPPANLTATPCRSPDGRLEAFIQNFNVAIRAVSPTPAAPSGPGGAAATPAVPPIVLSNDGSEGNPYLLQTIVWSPDSKKLAAYRVKPGYRREVHYIMSSPEDQLQPKHSTLLYNKPGDELDVERPSIFLVDSKQHFVVDNALFPNAYDVSRLEWRADSRGVTFEYNQRGHKAYRVIEVDATNGKARALVNEEMPTFVEYSGKKYRYDVNDGKEVIWASERDGWSHLYLYDGPTGRVKNQVTKGEWVMRGVERVDTIARQVYFRASGMNRNQDPYFVQYYRINLDGTGLVAYTESEANHAVSWSPDRQYYVDSYSRVDLPPVMALHRTSDQKLVAELERADAKELLATGWTYPEVFTSKARDGKTDIWGIIIRPTNFDASRKYPVIENIYAGPQSSFTPKTFSTQAGMQALAELGFIVVQVDGMGTSNRSKAFHDVAWQNLGDAGFPDRIIWHQAIASKYPWYDITRVGIYGTSAGGQNSMGALLFHPDFYKAAVSAAGCHDNRMDKIWWNEQWMGFPIGDHYSKSSNVDNAYKLQGNLLLVVGEMDANVDPSSTMQVVNSLIKANKDFDLLVLPGAGHTNGGAYGTRKRNDFFVHHLLGVEPPDRNIQFKASGATGNGSSNPFDGW